MRVYSILMRCHSCVDWSCVCLNLLHISLGRGLTESHWLWMDGGRSELIYYETAMDMCSLEAKLKVVYK